MDTKRIILGTLLVLFVMTISATTATATMEQTTNKVNLHASFENIDESGTSTFTMIDVFKYNEKMYLFIGQDIRDQQGNPISLAWGSKILEEGDFQVKRNLQSVSLLSSDIILTQWWPRYEDIVLNDIEVTWKSDEKAEVIHYNRNDPEYPKVQDLYINCEAIATGTFGESFHSYMEVAMSIHKV